MAEKILVNVFNVDAALAVGRANGLFAANGLDVDVMLTPNSTDQMRGLSKQSWPIVSTAFDNVLGWSGREGAEIIAVAQVAEGITLPVMVRPEIKSWEDLRGKPLAVDAVDTAYALVLRRVLLAHGLEMDRGDYTLVPEGATGPRFESMKAGKTFAGILNPPWDVRAVEAGLVRFADHREVLPDYPGGVFAVNKQWAANNTDTLKRFLKAWHDALIWCHKEKNREAAIKILSEAEKIDAKAAANRLRQLPKIGALNIAGLKTVLDLRVLFNLTPIMGKDLPVYCDAAYYEAATM